jgi:hypothetical protein
MDKYSKQEEIDKWIAEPLKINDPIIYTRINHHNKLVEEWGIVKEINGDIIKIYDRNRSYDNIFEKNISEIRKNTFFIGKNPFAKQIHHDKYSIDIDQLLFRCGWDYRAKTKKMEKYFNVDINEVCFDPIVFDENGNEIEYQRGLVWTLEQKQYLIESIYNRIEIGKFVFRSRSFKWVENRIKKGKIEHTAFKDMVDGKQRFHAILGFFMNEFPDIRGNYYNDLSVEAQRQFMSYNNLFYIELDEDVSDKDVLQQFLAINFTGVPMSKEHIEFVKSIKL